MSSRTIVWDLFDEASRWMSVEKICVLEAFFYFVPRKTRENKITSCKNKDQQPLVFEKKTTAESLLIPLILDGLYTYTAKDARYTASANTVTIKRFGPSGSLKKKNNNLEQMIAVAANMINEIFFDLKYRFSMLLVMSIR